MRKSSEPSRIFEKKSTWSIKRNKRNNKQKKQQIYQRPRRDITQQNLLMRSNLYGIKKMNLCIFCRYTNTFEEKFLISFHFQWITQTWYWYLLLWHTLIHLAWTSVVSFFIDVGFINFWGSVFCVFVKWKTFSHHHVATICLLGQVDGQLSYSSLVS